MNSLVYLVYGQGPHIDEVIYSVLSARNMLDRRSSECRIVLYTDDAAKFRGLPAQTEVKSGAVFAEWMGPLRFNHRAKIFAIRDALNKFGDRIVYCDSDTYFLRHPNELFSRIHPRRSLMHVCEGALNESNGAGLRAFLDHGELRTVRGRLWNITNDALMFNAGVIGMHKADAALLDEVVYLTDQIYPFVKIHTIEQFAFSVCLSQRTKLFEAYDVICHYWPMPGRALFQEELRRVLHDPSITSYEERIRQVTPHPPAQNVRPFRSGLRQRIRFALRRAYEGAHVSKTTFAKLPLAFHFTKPRS